MAATPTPSTSPRVRTVRQTVSSAASVRWRLEHPAGYLADEVLVVEPACLRLLLSPQPCEGDYFAFLQWLPPCQDSRRLVTAFAERLRCWMLQNLGQSAQPFRIRLIFYRAGVLLQCRCHA